MPASQRRLHLSTSLFFISDVNREMHGWGVHPPPVHPVIVPKVHCPERAVVFQLYFLSFFSERTVYEYNNPLGPAYLTKPLLPPPGPPPLSPPTSIQFSSDNVFVFFQSFISTKETTMFVCFYLPPFFLESGKRLGRACLRTIFFLFSR